MSFRNEQVAKELMKALSQVLQEENLFEKHGLVTITDIVVTPQLEQAKVFVSAMQHAEQVVRNFNKRTGWFTSAIKKKVNLRKIPKIVFEVDISVERVERLEELLDEE